MIQQFVQYLSNIKGYSANTCKAYEQDCRQFAQWMQSQKSEARWSTIERKDIDAYIISQAEKGLKPSTTNRQLASISGIYNYFIRENLLTENPVRYESRRQIAETIPNTIPLKDIQRAMTKLQGVEKFMVGILITTGIRIQELLDMTWECINFEDNSIKIIGKGNKERTVYTSSDILEFLRRYKDIPNAHGKVFAYGQRYARTLIYNALRPYTRAKQVSPHAIRHTFATELANRGENVAFIQQAMGHKHLETSQKYIDMTEIRNRRYCLDITKN